MKAKIGILIWITLLLIPGAQADTYNFGTGANQFSMDFANIGYAGNVGETQDYGSLGGIRTFGSVGYGYQMGKHEVTIDQFSKALSSSWWQLNLGNENYWQSVGLNAPATRTSFSEAAQFANWLTSGDSRYGAYTLTTSGFGVSSINRAAAIATYGTVFVIPTEDEWYKAAYFKSDGSGYTTYAHGDAIPGKETDANYGGLPSPWEAGGGTAENNGTYDMDGNVWEWFESPAFEPPVSQSIRGARSGSAGASEIVLRSSFRLEDPPGEDEYIGFRVAVIPEPSSVLLLMVGSGGILFYRRAKRREQENRVPSRKDFC